MKNYIITTALLVISFVGFSQVSPSGQFRVATAGTSFGINLPVGTQVFCVGTNDLYKVTVAEPSTASISVQGVGTLVLVAKPTDLSVGTTTFTTLDVNSSTGNAVTLPAATTGAAGLMTVAEVTKLAAITGTNTGDQTLTIAGTTSPTIALSGSNTATFAGSTGITLGQAAGTITITATDNSITNEGLLSVTGTSSAPLIHSNTSGSADIGLVAGTGISISTTGTAITLNTTGVGTNYKVQSFEEDLSTYNGI